MKTFLFISIFFLVALFGVGEVYGQVNRSCLPCSPNPNAQGQIRTSNFRLVDSNNNRINVTDCKDLDLENDFFLTFEYTVNSNIRNVFFSSDLTIIDNTQTNSPVTIPFDFFIGDIASTGGGPNATSGTIKVKITLPTNYDCETDRLLLDNIQLNWITSGGPNSNNNPSCSDYVPGSCRKANNPENISVAGFIFDFEHEVGCFEEDGSLLVTYIITKLAGGSGNYNITWDINKNGTITQVQDRFIVPVFLTSPNDIITGSLNVTHSGPELSNPIPGPQTALIGIPFTPPTYSVNNNIQDITPNPNGSININLPPEEVNKYEFIWRDDNGNFYNPSDPTELNNLDQGGYVLTMIDKLTGICRRFDFALASILPVELLDPSARYENTNKLSRISWATAKEVSNSHFEIERSDKGINEFKKVGEIDGMGWKDTVTEYEFIDDKLPLSGGNILYRIKQVDFDGNFTYSKVLSVRAEGVQATQGVWRAFPNPTMGDQLRISLLDRSQYDEEQITFRIIHPNLITQGITVNSENEMNDQLAQLIPRAPKGVLVVEIQWGQKVEHIKVLKK